MKYWHFEEKDGPFKATGYRSRRELVDAVRSQYQPSLLLRILYKLDLYGFAVVESVHDGSTVEFHTDVAYRLRCLDVEPIDDVEAGIFIGYWVAEEDDAAEKDSPPAVDSCG